MTIRQLALPPRRRKLPARHLQAPGGASESKQYSLPQAVTCRGGAALIPRGIRPQAQGRFRARVCIRGLHTDSAEIVIRMWVVRPCAAHRGVCGVEAGPASTPGAHATTQQAEPCRRVQERAERTQLNASDRTTGFFVEAIDKVTNPSPGYGSGSPRWIQRGTVCARVCISVSFHRGEMGAPFPLHASLDRNVGYVDKRSTFIAWRRCRRGFPSSFLELKVHLHVCKFCACHVCTLLARAGCIVSIVSTAMTGRNNAVKRVDDRAARIVDTVSTLPRLRRLRAAWRIGYGAGIVPLSRIAAQPASHARCLRWCPRRFVQVEDLVEDRSCRHCGGLRGSLIGSRALAAYGDVDGPSAANNRPWSRKCTARLLRRSDASASAHGCAGTRSVRLGGAGSVG